VGESAEDGAEWRILMRSLPWCDVTLMISDPSMVELGLEWPLPSCPVEGLGDGGDMVNSIGRDGAPALFCCRAPKVAQIGLE